MVSKKSALLGRCVLALLISGMGGANAQHNAGSASVAVVAASTTMPMEENQCGEAGVEISPKTNRVTIRPGEEPQVDILAALSITG